MQEFINFADNYVPNINVVELDTKELAHLGKTIMPQTGLNLDDAYQYSCAKKYELELVSFDKDFDKTDLKRKEP